MRTGGSNVGCSHAAECPLFPLLRASLQGWRDYYCDSAHQWQDCARYRMSLTGEPVPISLLPNGAAARHLEGTAGANRGPAHPTQTHAQAHTQQAQQAPPPRSDPWSQEAGAWSQPTPAGPPQPSQAWTAAPQDMTPFGATPASAPVRHQPPSPSAGIPRSPDPTARSARQASGPKRGWWARLADWMRGPA